MINLNVKTNPHQLKAPQGLHASIEPHSSTNQGAQSPRQLQLRRNKLRGHRVDMSWSLGALEEGLLQPTESSVRFRGVLHQMDAQLAQILKDKSENQKNVYLRIVYQLTTEMTCSCLLAVHPSNSMNGRTSLLNGKALPLL